MRACLWRGPGIPLELVEMPMPRLRSPADVVLRMERAMFGAALRRAATTGHPKLVPPAVLGSLVVGEVVATGEAVSHVRPGDRVVLDPHPSCGACGRCRSSAARACGSGASLTPGALAEFVLVGGQTPRAVHPLAPGTPADAAIFAEPLACALAAVQDAEVGPTDDVLIVGSGQLAFLLSWAASRAGARSVTCLVKDSARERAIRAAGARTVRLATPGTVPEDIDPPSVVIEAVGRPETYELCLRSVAPGGTVVAFGGCPPGTLVPLDINRLHYDGVRIVGSYHFPAPLFAEALDALTAGALDTAPLSRHHLALEDLPRAPALSARPGVLAVLVSP
jgi:L-iditol 2-dehydrogenase